MAIWSLAFAHTVFWIFGAIVIGSGSPAIFPSVTSALLTAARDSTSRSAAAGAYRVDSSVGRRSRRYSNDCYIVSCTDGFNCSLDCSGCSRGQLAHRTQDSALLRVKEIFIWFAPIVG